MQLSFSSAFAAMTKLDSSVSQLRTLLAQLAAAKGDLSHLTAPPFVLAPRSAVEIPACWAARQDLFLALASEPDPSQRALLVARNFACSLAGLVDLGSDYTGRKPLNPFLGELFLGTFLPDGVSRTSSSSSSSNGSEDGNERRERMGSDGTAYVAEQVSHHPPVTACATYNRRHGIDTRGFAAQEMSFSASSGVMVRQLGCAVVSDRVHGETHLMTLPTMQVRGIATGQLQPELWGRCWISSSSGYVTSIDLDGKSSLGFGGTSHSIKAVVHEVDGMKPVYRITGRWDGEMSIEDLRGGDDGERETFQFDDKPATELTVAPVEEQTAWESRRAWAGVIRGIKKGDMNMVIKHKTVVEEEQRRRRQEEQDKGEAWTSLFFRHSDTDDEVASLLAQIPEGGETLFDPQRTGGFWNFVGPDEAEELMTRLK